MYKTASVLENIGALADARQDRVGYGAVGNRRERRRHVVRMPARRADDRESTRLRPGILVGRRRAIGSDDAFRGNIKDSCKLSEYAFRETRDAVPANEVPRGADDQLESRAMPLKLGKVGERPDGGGNRRNQPYLCEF